ACAAQSVRQGRHEPPDKPGEPTAKPARPRPWGSFRDGCRGRSGRVVGFGCGPWAKTTGKTPIRLPGFTTTVQHLPAGRPLYAGSLSSAMAMAEKVRPQFLSLRQSSG